MHHTFHHIPKTGGSTLRIRLEDRANKKQISKLDYAVGHNTTYRTPGTHFVWLRHPLDRDISHFNYDMGKGDIDGDSFQEHCGKLAGNFMILWLYTNYLCKDKEDSIDVKYNAVRMCLRNTFKKVFCLKNFEQSWNEVADTLNIDREPRQNTNRSLQDYKKYISKEDLDEQFISWHENHNKLDYQLYYEFCP